MNFKNKTLKIFLYRTLCGFLLGVSIIAPGVSGSVMAVIMGIYGDLIGIISAPFKNFKQNVIYMIPLGVGALLSAILLIKALGYMFDAYSLQSFLLFMGLIAGSLPSVLNEAKSATFKPHLVIYALIAFALAITISILAKNEAVLTVERNVLYFSFCGFIAGVVSMVPGMSVSMVLMLLGVYKPMLEATSKFDIVTMAPVAVFFVVGIFLFSRVMKYVFERYKSLGYIIVFGFMCGSLIGIYPGLPASSIEWITGIIAVITGLTISVLFGKLAKKLKI